MLLSIVRISKIHVVQEVNKQKIRLHIFQLRNVVLFIFYVRLKILKEFRVFSLLIFIKDINYD